MASKEQPFLPMDLESAFPFQFHKSRWSMNDRLLFHQPLEQHLSGNRFKIQTKIWKDLDDRNLFPLRQKKFCNLTPHQSSAKDEDSPFMEILSEGFSAV
jgi:hypothetical protein